MVVWEAHKLGFINTDNWEGYENDIRESIKNDTDMQEHWSEIRGKEYYPEGFTKFLDGMFPKPHSKSMTKEK